MQVIGITIGIPMPVPMLARAVRAGFASSADDFIEQEIDLQRLLITNRPATFLVRVAGNSMVGKGLRRHALGTDYVTIFYHISEHDRGSPQRSVSTVVRLHDVP